MKQEQRNDQEGFWIWYLICRFLIYYYLLSYI